MRTWQVEVWDEAGERLLGNYAIAADTAIGAKVIAARIAAERHGIADYTLLYARAV